MVYIDFHTHLPTAEGVISPRSFGIHPWNAGEEPSATFDEFERRHHEEFDAADIIGECGLDKVCDTPWDDQLRIFEWHLLIAREMGKPVVVHCVRAYNELILLSRQFRQVSMAVHGFTGNSTLAGQLTREGIALSFGAALLDSARRKVHETLRTLPCPFLLETDTSDCGIADIYEAAAEIRKTSVEELGETIKTAYNTLMRKPFRSCPIFPES